ncbi:hypothetical protein M8J76_001043 [Diaphorina citri]|nr:hypothetical protein M8J76_001043 [Diaphorina citri]
MSESELIVHLCSVFHIILNKFKNKDHDSIPSRNRHEYLPFVNSDLQQRSSLSEFIKKIALVIKKVILFLNKVTSAVFRWKDRVSDLLEKSEGSYYNSDILATSNTKNYGFHLNPNSLFNTMEYNKVQYACTCSNSCNTPSFQYCRNRYDKQYDFKYGVWSRASSSAEQTLEAKGGDEKWVS